MIREPCNATSAMVVSEANCSTVSFDVDTLVQVLVNWDRQTKHLGEMVKLPVQNEFVTSGCVVGRSAMFIRWTVIRESIRGLDFSKHMTAYDLCNVRWIVALSLPDNRLWREQHQRIHQMPCGLFFSDFSVSAR